MAEIAGVILAGGRSRRMGRDKARLPFGGYPTMAEYQYRRLAPLFGRIYLSLKEGDAPFAGAAAIRDRSPEPSPLAALEGILEGVDADGVFVIGVDMPFVRRATIEALLEEYRRGCEAGACPPALAIRSEAGIEPLCAVYSPAIQPALRSMLALGRHRLGELLEAVGARYLQTGSADEFANLNTPGEYARALRR
ncbi:molybdenum cofactor guanylyltransferase [Nitratifractor sp.]